MSDPVTFIDACKAGRLDVLRRMLEKDPSLVDAQLDDQMPAILHATCANRIDVVDLLISRGAAIEAKDAEFKATAIGFAAWHGYADIAALLVEAGADVDGMGEDPSPLALALDGVDGKLMAEGSPGTREDHAAIVALLQSRNARVIGRIQGYPHQSGAKSLT
jgi:ankyrin repeat protein